MGDGEGGQKQAAKVKAAEDESPEKTPLPYDFSAQKTSQKTADKIDGMNSKRHLKFVKLQFV